MIRYVYEWFALGKPKVEHPSYLTSYFCIFCNRFTPHLEVHNGHERDYTGDYVKCSVYKVFTS